MSREYGTPPNQVLGIDFGPVGNFTFNERIFILTCEDFPSPFIYSREDMEEGDPDSKPTAKKEHRRKMRRGPSKKKVSEWKRKRDARREASIAYG